MSTLWITSFNKPIYNTTAKMLLESFIATETEGQLLCCTENISSLLPYSKRNNIWRIAIEEHEMLKTFIEKNKDIILRRLGGNAEPCDCPDPNAREQGKHHNKNCYHTWFNRNMIKWFRKIVSLKVAISGIGKKFDRYIWLDADCIFRQKVTEKWLISLLEENSIDVLYLKSKYRAVLEAGFVCYNGPIGLQVITMMIFRYMSGNFRDYYRWDDCYILQKIIDKMKCNKKDIATKLSGYYSDVFLQSSIGEHIIHNKGVHFRKHGIIS